MIETRTGDNRSAHPIAYQRAMRSAWAEAFGSILAAVVSVIPTTAYLVWILLTPALEGPLFVALAGLLLIGFVFFRRFRKPRHGEGGLR